MLSFIGIVDLNEVHVRSVFTGSLYVCAHQGFFGVPPYLRYAVLVLFMTYRQWYRETDDTTGRIENLFAS